MSIQLALPLILASSIFNKNGHFRQLLMWVRLRWMTLGWLKEVFPTVSISRTENLAQEIVKDYPDYDVIWNNCQKFVAYLLETASPGCPLPTTLEAMFLSLATFFEGSNETTETRLPGAYPRSSRLRAIKTYTESTEFFTAIDLGEDEAEDLTPGMCRLLLRSHVGTGDADTTQVGPSVNEFLALWRHHLQMEEAFVADLSFDGEHRKGWDIISLHREIRSNGLENSLPPILWIYSAKIYDCLRCSMQYRAQIIERSPLSSPDQRETSWEDLLQSMDAEIQDWAQVAFTEAMKDESFKASLPPEVQVFVNFSKGNFFRGIDSEYRIEADKLFGFSFSTWTLR